MIILFLVRSILAAIGVFLAAIIVPSIETDGMIGTFVLLGIVLGIGEVILATIRYGVSLILFFLPSFIRTFLLRAVIVTIGAGLITGFSFTSPILVGIIGTTLLLTLLFALPFTSS